MTSTAKPKVERVRAGWYRLQVADGGTWVHVKRHGSEWAVFVNESQYTVESADYKSGGFCTLAGALEDLGYFASVCHFCSRKCSSVDRHGEPVCSRCKKTYGGY